MRFTSDRINIINILCSYIQRVLKVKEEYQI